jgi:ATP-dependent helicase/nuclease subunit A
VVALNYQPSQKFINPPQLFTNTKPMPTYTSSQLNVISARDTNLLISASAGTGKTTVMIQRICDLITDGLLDVGNILVVTFTNLAAADMKRRLVEKLSGYSADAKIVAQLEKIDTASISTLHKFCADLLRNYFYIVDIDPAYTIVDTLTAKSMKNSVLSDLLAEHYAAADDDFNNLYSVFASARNDDSIKDTILSLYEFSRTEVDFYTWYDGTRQYFLDITTPFNPVADTIFADLTQKLDYYRDSFAALAVEAQNYGVKDFPAIFSANSSACTVNHQGGLFSLLSYLATIEIASLPPKSAKDKTRHEDEHIIEEFRIAFKNLKTALSDELKKYAPFLGKSAHQLKDETASSVVLTDKLVAILREFDTRYFEAKKQRGLLDFGDLEQLTLRVLSDPEALSELKAKYQFIFVDEYQDTNNVQEAIVSALAGTHNMFMVGDVKQSIYGFRGCDPTIFVKKYHKFKAKTEGTVIELNENFRSNVDILHFVNTVMAHNMTQNFGEVDYINTSMLTGALAQHTAHPAVNIDIISENTDHVDPISGVYDIKNNDAPASSYALREGHVLARRIKQIVGSDLTIGGVKRKITYGDVAILARSINDRVMQMYNVLLSYNIPVSASLKMQGYENKEVRDIITLLRVIDNPSLDIALAGACLSSFCGLTHDELATVKLSGGEAGSLFGSINAYIAENVDGDEIAFKLSKMLSLIDDLRFFSYTANVNEVVLRLLQKTDFALYVQGLPNGFIRIKKLYAFIDDIKGKVFSSSIDKFLTFIDESDESVTTDSAASSAVRLMTMHGSKGLEFPVVFVVDSDTTVKQDTSAVKTNLNVGVAMKHYDFAATTKTDSIGERAVTLFNRRKEKQEALRLLYVALTRAKNHLYITMSATDWLLYTETLRLPSEYNTHAEWIVSALKAKYGDRLKDGFFEDGIALNIDPEVPVTAAALSSDLLVPQSDDLEAALQQLNHKYPHLEAVTLPTKVVSSALDKDYLKLDDDEVVEVIAPEGDSNVGDGETIKSAIDNNKSALLGTAYHKIYEHAQLNSTTEQLAAIVDRYVRPDPKIGTVADDIDLELAAKPLHNAALVALCEGGKLYHEVPFMLNCSYNDITNSPSCETVMLQGVIDLLVLHENHAIVIDFKLLNNSFYAKQNYTRQLSSYKMAVKNITGITDVTAYIMSIADDKLIEV